MWKKTLSSKGKADGEEGLRKDGLQWPNAEKVRPDEPDVICVTYLCRFLRMCPGLSRQLIGDLLGENNERCLRVLECFTASFDFTGEYCGDRGTFRLSDMYAGKAR
jgi:hypothetical protein